jgi:hypothetical protein
MGAVRPVFSTLALVVTLLAAGCSVHVDTRFVSQDELEKKVVAALTENVGFAPESAECPDSLAVRVGSETRCTLTDSGEIYGVTVTLTKVGKGTDVELHAEVDQ